MGYIMLYRSKSTIVDSIKTKVIEFSEGTKGSGSPIYIIVTYFKHTNLEYSTNYHEEWFDNINEADCWYNLTN